MDNKSAPPPRKKARFSTSDENTMTSSSRNHPVDESGKKEEQMDLDYTDEDRSLSKLDGRPLNDNLHHESSSTAEKSIQLALPDRSAKPTTYQNVPERKTSGPSSSSDTNSNRRHGIYGAQNFGLTTNGFEAASIVTNRMPLPPGIVAPYKGPACPAQATQQPVPLHHNRPVSWQPPGLSNGQSGGPMDMGLLFNASRQSLAVPGSLIQQSSQPPKFATGFLPPTPLNLTFGNGQSTLQPGGFADGQSYGVHDAAAAGNSLGQETIQGQKTEDSNTQSISPQNKQIDSNVAVDTDRDETGALLPLHERGRGTIQLNSVKAGQLQLARREPPPNFYTSPQRLAKIIATSSSSLKRKSSGPNPAPTAYIYVRSDNPDFNVFSNGFLLYPELCFALATHLPLRDLVSLYSISRDYRTIIDSRFTTVCLAQDMSKAPTSAKAFRFRSYAEYCRKIPAARLPHPGPAKAAQGIPRQIPSFRWVAFVMHREQVVHELITVFAERGCPLPARCGPALTKLWMLFDIPDNARRIALIPNHHMFSELDLYFLTCFFIKLDMVTNNPVATHQRDGLRKLLLTQNGGLDIILKVLKRQMWQKQSDVLIAWVRTIITLERLTTEELDCMNVDSVLGVPRSEVDRGKYEYWGLRGTQDPITGKRRRYLLRPDQLVMREAIRSGSKFGPHYMRCLMYGYVRPDTLESYQPRTYGRRIKEWDDAGHDPNGNLGGFRALSLEDGGDPLLNLDVTSRGSRYTIVKKSMSERERNMREQQAKLLEDLYQVSEEGQLNEMDRA